MLWTDRSDPSHPWVHPVTQGLLGMRSYLIRSTDGGRSWPDRRRIDLGAHPGASVTGPVLRLSDGMLAQPFENWKEYEDPTPGIPAAWLRLSPDDGATWTDDVLVARHPDNAIYYWDQRLATHPVDGRIVNMFWTHVPADGRDIDVHISWGTPDGRTWTDPVGTGLPGQHCQPISLGGDRLLAVYSHRNESGRHPGSISEDFGRTWDRIGGRRVGQRGGRRSRAPAPHGPRRSTGTTWAPGSSGTRAARCCRTARSSSCSTADRAPRAAAAGPVAGVTDLLLRDAWVVDARGHGRAASTCSSGRAGSRRSATGWTRRPTGRPGRPW